MNKKLIRQAASIVNEVMGPKEWGAQVFNQVLARKRYNPNVAQLAKKKSKEAEKEREARLARKAELEAERADEIVQLAAPLVGAAKAAGTLLARGAMGAAKVGAKAGRTLGTAVRTAGRAGRTVGKVRTAARVARTVFPTERSPEAENASTEIETNFRDRLIEKIRSAKRQGESPAERRTRMSSEDKSKPAERLPRTMTLPGGKKVVKPGSPRTRQGRAGRRHASRTTTYGRGARGESGVAGDTLTSKSSHTEVTVEPTKHTMTGTGETKKKKVVRGRRTIHGPQAKLP